MKNTLLAGIVFALASCGTAYQSPIVRGDDENSPVRVIQMTGESVLIANSSTYNPRSLTPLRVADPGYDRPAFCHSQ